MLKKELQAWFADRPSLSARGIAKEAGMDPDGRFQRYIKAPAKSGERVTRYYLAKISPVLKKYDGCGQLFPTEGYAP